MKYERLTVSPHVAPHHSDGGDLSPCDPGYSPQQQKRPHLEKHRSTHGHNKLKKTCPRHRSVAQIYYNLLKNTERKKKSQTNFPFSNFRERVDSSRTQCPTSRAQKKKAPQKCSCSPGSYERKTPKQLSAGGE